jgi:hypothetical protein
MLRRAFLISLLVLFVSTVSALAQSQSSDSGAVVKNKYLNAEVATFDVKEGVTVPDGFLKSLAQSITTELQKTKKFTDVRQEGETSTTATTSAAATPSAPTVLVRGTITNFKAGSRAKRYLVGFGAGKSKVVAHVKYIDKATGGVLFEEDVTGDVVMGLFGGDSGGATREVAKDVAKSAKKRLF